jgi:tetratricopeptide (TPR) repeat protein
MHPSGGAFASSIAWGYEPAMSNAFEVRDRLLGYFIATANVSNNQPRRLILFSLLITLCFAVGSVPSQGQSIAKPDAANRPKGQEFYQQGVALIRQQQFDEGIVALKKGLDSDPSNLLILDAIGAAYSIQGKPIEAERYFSTALEIDSTFTPARKNLAITYFTAGQYEQATAEFEKLRTGPADLRPIACLFLGMLAEKKHEYSRSVVFLKESGDLLEQYTEAVLSLSRSLYELHRQPEAKGTLLRLDRMPGVTPFEYFDAGVLYSQFGDDQRALSAFDQAERFNKPVDGLEYQRAEALARLGRQQDALSALTKIALNNPNPDALNHLAHVAQDSHQYDLAIQSLRLAAKLDPKNEDNYLQFSTICSDAGKYLEALQAVDLGLQNIPNSYRLLVQKAAVLDNMARRAEAEQILQAAVGLRSDNSEALLSLAIVQTNANELKPAADTLRAAIEKFPDNFYMHYWLGYVLVQTDEGETANAAIELEAERAFRAAIRLKPTFADSYYQLSRLHMHKNEKLAEQNLTDCLRADPNYGPAQYALAQLYLKTGRRAEGYKLYAKFKDQQDMGKASGPPGQSTEPVQR